MNRTLAPLATLTLAGAAALTAAPAHAAEVGLGSSFGMGFDYVNVGFELEVPFRRVPTLDVRIDGLLIQLYPLDLLLNLPSENIVFGASVYAEAVSRPIEGKWNAVVSPGVTLALADFDGLSTVIMPTARIGAQVEGDASLGVYVVPSVGLGIVDGELGLAAGGRVEMSVWFQ